MNVYVYFSTLFIAAWLDNKEWHLYCAFPLLLTTQRALYYKPLSPTHSYRPLFITLTHRQIHHGQSGVQFLASGNFTMQTGGADQWMTLTPEPPLPVCGFEQCPEIPLHRFQKQLGLKNNCKAATIVPPPHTLYFIYMPFKCHIIPNCP